MIMSEIATKIKTQAEELRAEMDRAAGEHAAKRARVDELVSELAVIEARTGNPSATVSENDVADWFRRKEILPTLIRRARVEEGAAETQARQASHRWQNLSAEREQYQRAVTELESYLKPGGSIDQRVAKARKQIVTGERLNCWRCALCWSNSGSEDLPSSSRLKACAVRPCARKCKEMQSPGKNLTAKQERALVALLNCGTIKEASEECRVNETTLWRWLQLEEFQVRYRAARRQVVEHAIAQMQQDCSAAAKTLRTVADDASAPASSRVAAARAIIENAIKGVELGDLEDRIKRLEETLIANGGRKAS
jgi:hypothetical protein